MINFDHPALLEIRNWLDATSSLILVCFFIRVIILWHEKFSFVIRLVLALAGYFSFMNMISVIKHLYVPSYTQFGMHVGMAFIAGSFLWKWRRLENNPQVFAQSGPPRVATAR